MLPPQRNSSAHPHFLYLVNTPVSTVTQPAAPPSLAAAPSRSSRGPTAATHPPAPPVTSPLGPQGWVFGARLVSWLQEGEKDSRVAGLSLPSSDWVRVTQVTQAVSHGASVLGPELEQLSWTEAAKPRGPGATSALRGRPPCGRGHRGSADTRSSCI